MRGRPKKVKETKVVEESSPQPVDYADIGISASGSGPFDSDLFLAAAQIAGAMAASAGGYQPQFTKVAVKIARELREAISA